MRPPHTQLNESFRLQFPFVFRQPQSLQLLLLARPCLSTFSGLPLSRPIAASASLSDPRCFRALSTASVLGSDYSASVSSFPCFLTPPHSGFLSAPFSLSILRFSPFSPAWFPVHSFPVPVLSFAVRFLSPFPDSLPRPFLRCFSFEIFRFPSASFRQLSFHFRLLSPLFLPFRSSRFRLTVASPVRPSAFASWLSPFVPTWFPMPTFPVFVLSFAVRFLSSFPVSLPQPFHWCFPFGSLLGDQRMASAFFRLLPL